MSSKQDKARETHLGNLLTQHMYAVIKDNDNSSDRLDPYKSITNQTYDNLMRKKDDPKKIDEAESRFTIQTDVKQQLTYILKCVGVEVGNERIQLNDADKVANIIAKLTDEFDDDSVVAPFFSFGTSTNHCFGNTLKGSTDETNWLQAQMIGMLPHLKTKLHLIAELTTAFDNSLRAIAWYLGRGVWFGAEKKTISSNTFMYILSMPCTTMYSLNTIDLISKQVRAKVAKVKKSPAKTDGTAATPTGAEAVVTPVTGETVAEAINNVVSTVQPTPSVQSAPSVPVLSNPLSASSNNMITGELTELLNI